MWKVRGARTVQDLKNSLTTSTSNFWSELQDHRLHYPKCFQCGELLLACSGLMPVLRNDIVCTEFMHANLTATMACKGVLLAWGWFLEPIGS